MQYNQKILIIAQKIEIEVFLMLSYILTFLTARITSGYFSILYNIINIVTIIEISYLQHIYLIIITGVTN